MTNPNRLPLLTDRTDADKSAEIAQALARYTRARHEAQTAREQLQWALRKAEGVERVH